MNNSIWGNVDFEGLIQDAKEAATSGEFKEVPVGKYEVRVDKMETKLSKKGSPMLSIRFKVLEGEFKGSLIFYNQVLTSGFGFHNANEFLRSLESGISVEPATGAEFDALLLDIAEKIDGTLEYVLVYGKNDKGYNTYEIEEVFEV